VSESQHPHCMPMSSVHLLTMHRPTDVAAYEPCLDARLTAAAASTVTTEGSAGRATCTLQSESTITAGSGTDSW
jgi:hypothetical protein